MRLARLVFLLPFAVAGARAGALEPPRAIELLLPGDDRPSEAPLAFDVGDFDGDGIADLVCGFRGGLVTLHRGNPAAIHPHHPAASAVEGTRQEPFAPAGRAVAAGRDPEWLGSGDFDADGRRDLVLAAGEAPGLEWLRGDGAGGFARTELPLPGRVAALAVGEFGRVDGLADLAVAVVGPQGAKLLLWVDSRGALAAEPLEIDLASEPTALAFGDADGDGLQDVALRGAAVVVVHGDHRPVIESFAGTPLRVTRLPREAWPVTESETTELPPSAIDSRWLRLDDDAVPDLLVLQQVQPFVVAFPGAVSATFTVTNTADSGAGSLRQAILDTNANLGADRILFDIPGAGPHVIQPLSPLAAMNGPVTIDGTSQPGYAGTPLVVIDGSLAAPTDGLVLAGGTSVVRGLTIGNWGIAGIFVALGDGNIIEANQLVGNDRGIELATSANRVGGADPAARNVISAQAGPGILIAAADVDETAIEGNYIGTDATGSIDAGNGGPGIDWFELGSGGSLNVIGGTEPGTGNLISGNEVTGVRLRGNAHFVRVQGNLIGTDATGSAALGNRGAGVRIDDTGNHTIGGSLPARNVISGNLPDPPDPGAGVEVLSTGSGIRNTIERNFIGVDVTGGAALGNPIGVRVEGDQNYIGSLNQGNVVSGNTLEGVRLSGDSNDVQGNWIGTDATGSFAIPNGADGLLLEGSGSADNDVRDNRAISGNLGWGVRVSGLGTPVFSNDIYGNNVGTDEAGTSAVGNLLGGVRITGSTNTVVGGAFAGGGNLVGGNGQDGISSDSPVTIVGNVVGLDAGGATAIPNLRHGIFVSDAAGAVIGGTTSNERNVVSGNVATGIRLQSVTSAEIRGNRVGTDAAGEAAVPNQTGIEVSAFTTLTIENNLACGNFGTGITLVSGTGAALANNGVGTTFSDAPLGNGGKGILLNAVSLSQIGTSILPGNRIAYNGDDGIAQIGGAGNTIRYNALHDNGGLGIDLGDDGITANDLDDSDTGANQLQNYPLIDSATLCLSTLGVVGTLHSAPSSDFMVDLNLVESCDPSGYGEGVGGSLTELVTTDAFGVSDYSFSDSLFFIGEFPTGVTATATSTTGNTSEFSECRPIVSLAPGFLLDVSWVAGNTTNLHWTPAPTAVLLHTGSGAELPGLVSPPSVGCAASFPSGDSTGDFLTEVPPAGGFFWYVARPINGCGYGPAGDGTAGVRYVSLESCCAHDTCNLGDPLEATCDPCVAQVCAADAYCCSGLWDSGCVEAVVNVCGLLDCDPQGTCPGSLCDTHPGTPFTAGCDEPPIVPSCVSQICATDSFCCTTEWDDLCVDEVESICGLTCPTGLLFP